MEKSEILVGIGSRIRELREQKGVSQQDLAAACNFEKSNMSRLESGKTNFTIGSLLKISKALQVKLKDLVDVEDR